MRSSLRTLAVTVVVAAASALVVSVAVLWFWPAGQRGDMEKVVRDYLLANPEVLQEAYNVLEQRQAEAEQRERNDAIKKNEKALFSSPRQVVLGNPKGDVTLVEFFDYNCVYCKHALPDMMALLKTDPKLRVVLKEFPVLGPGSVEAARVAAAVRMQDDTGKKYLEFHQKLLGGRGKADQTRALAVAGEIGLDMERLERDVKSDEVRDTIKEGYSLGEALKINGTPSYVVGDEVMIGAVGLDHLRESISKARCGQPTC